MLYEVIPVGLTENRDVDLDSFAGDGDSDFDLGFEGVLERAAFVVTKDVGWVNEFPWTIESFIAGELTVIGDPGGITLLKIPSEGISDRLDVDACVSRGASCLEKGGFNLLKEEGFLLFAACFVVTIVRAALLGVNGRAPIIK